MLKCSVARHSAHGVSCAAIAARVFAAVLSLCPFAASAASTSVVISQIYGAGGNTGALYQNDYV